MPSEMAIWARTRISGQAPVTLARDVRVVKGGKRPTGVSMPRTVAADRTPHAKSWHAGVRSLEFKPRRLALGHDSQLHPGSKGVFAMELRYSWRRNLSPTLVHFLLVSGIAVLQPASIGATQQSDGQSLYPPISFDGSVVAFHSLGTNLVPGDTNGVGDVFVLDRAAGIFQRVSISTTGSQANGISTYAALSGNGRFVVFTSSANNLVVGDTNGVDDVFVRDRFNGTTERVTLSASGQESNGPSYNYNLPISADGRYVVFQSLASNLVASDTNNTWDVFLRDRLTGTTTRVSVGSGGVEANGPSLHSSISSYNGRYVAFHSFATNLASGDANMNPDVFRRDTLTNTTTLISADSVGLPANDYSDRASIDGSGRYVAFSSGASNLVPGDTNSIEDVFVRDAQLGTTSRVSVSTADVQMNGGVLMDRKASTSANARFILFRSDAANLVSGDNNNVQDIFVRDRDVDGDGVFDEPGAVSTERISVSSTGVESNGQSDHHAISEDGSFVTFSSSGTNLVAGDTNGVDDIFLRNRLTGVTTRVSISGGASFPSYCTPGTSATGCVASISALGTPSASLPSGFSIDVMQVESLKNGIIFYGESGPTLTLWAAGGTSYLCVRSPVQRLPLLGSGGSLGQCDGSLSIDWNAYRAAHPSALGSPFAVGDRLWAQAWYRDPPSPKTTSLSDALTFALQP
jgi:hypothetical protein